MRLLILLGVFLLVSTSSYADIMNGGFETGDLTNWSVGGTDGNVQVLKSGQFASNDGPPPSVKIAAPSGFYYALLSNGAGNSGGAALQTSTLTSDPYLVGAGANISFLLDFFTSEFSTANGGNPDFYDVFVLKAGVPVATLASGDVDGAQTTFPTVNCVSVFLVAPDNTTVCSHSTLQPFTNLDLSLYAGSVVQFQFLVSNAVDNNFDSALLVDAVHGAGLTDVNALSGVPEPQSWILLLTVAIIVYFTLRRQLQHRRTSAASQVEHH